MTDKHILSLEDAANRLIEWVDTFYPGEKEDVLLDDLRAALATHQQREADRNAEVERLKAEKELTSPFLNAARIFALILQDADRSMESRRAVQSRFVELSNEYAAAIKEAQE